jgi:hypothetical protein
LELKNCKADASKCCPTRISCSRESLRRCNFDHWRSQWVLLKRTYKKIFGLHLSKTTSFLVNQTTQHNADAAVNNNILCLFPPHLDHLLKRSSMLLGGAMPNSICTARHKNLAYMQSTKKVLNCFWRVTEGTSRVPIPITPSKIVFG